MTGVLTNGGDLDTDRDRRTASWEGEGWDGSDASTIYGTSKMPANPLKLGERRGTRLLRSRGGNQPCQHVDLWPPELGGHGRLSPWVTLFAVLCDRHRLCAWSPRSQCSALLVLAQRQRSLTFPAHCVPGPTGNSVAEGLPPAPQGRASAESPACQPVPTTIVSAC